MKKLLTIALTALMTAAALCAFAANPNFKDDNSNDIKHVVNAPLNDKYTEIWDELSKGKTAGYMESLYDFEAELFDLVNEYREKNGVEPLIWNDNVAEIARLRSLGGLAYPPMTSHDIKAIGGEMKGTMKLCGLDYSGAHVENFAQKGKSKKTDIPPSAILEQWKKSTGHNANLLDKSMKYGAIGGVYSKNVMDKGMYGVMVTMCAVK